MPLHTVAGLVRASMHPRSMRRIVPNLRDGWRMARGSLPPRRSPEVTSVPRPKLPCRPLPYRPGETLVPVQRVTPAEGDYTLHFFDVSPWSPSGRYLAVTRLPVTHRIGRLGEAAEICVIDTWEHSIEVVARSWGWSLQLGAHLLWGATDQHLYYDDVLSGRGVCVRLDLDSGEPRAYSAPIYDIAPDEGCALSPPLDLINLSQEGYGVPVPAWPPRRGLPDDQGLWRTDLRTGEVRLLLSLADAGARIPSEERVQRGRNYFFHTKFNRQGSRILQVQRTCFDGVRRAKAALLTFASDGSDIQCAFRPEQWARGGHHPNWHPGGEHIVMNAVIDGALRFVQFRFDGSDLKVLSERHSGSGHPSVDPSGRYLIADAYQGEGLAGPGPEIPIRCLDLHSDELVELCRIEVRGGYSPLRCDAHPVWSRDGQQIAFNGAPGGRRGLYVADVAAFAGTGILPAEAHTGRSRA